jgi:hypothetical protein
MAKIKKAQSGKAVKSAPPKGYIESEMFPGKMIKKSESNYESGNIRKMLEKPAPAKKVAKPAAAPVKKAAPAKKMKSGGTLGMKSVKAGYDKNPGVTRADIIVAAKGQAKYGGKVKMKKGGKMKACKYGC